MGFFELALISSVSPQTLAVVLYLLGGTRGLRHAWLFVAGTLLTSLASGALVAYGIVLSLLTLPVWVWLLQQLG